MNKEEALQKAIAHYRSIWKNQDKSKDSYAYPIYEGLLQVQQELNKFQSFKKKLINFIGHDLLGETE